MITPVRLVLLFAGITIGNVIATTFTQNWASAASFEIGVITALATVLVLRKT